MKLEHVALNVTDPVAMAAWYVAHLGMQVVRKIDTAPHTHFLADTGGTMLIEIYSNPTDAVPRYGEMHPLRLHLAFVSADPDADIKALLAAGATLFQDEKLADGSRVVMLRDPWGLPIQLCHRTRPMLRQGR